MARAAGQHLAQPGGVAAVLRADIRGARGHHHGGHCRQGALETPSQSSCSEDVPRLRDTNALRVLVSEVERRIDPGGV
eukprot:3243630-Pyramimonas_sp.AAC.1